MTKTKNSHLLILKDVNAFEVIKNVEEIKQIHIPETPIDLDEEDVNISSLVKEKSQRCIYFLDQYKNKIRYWVNMIDYTQSGALPLYTKKPCWWCRHSFDTHPIGCPIKYNTHKKTGIEKERVESCFSNMNLSFEKNDFFETIGIFCSFPCVKAFIYDEMSKGDRSRYKDSLTLLSLLYEKLFGHKQIIPKAGDYKNLKDYGGHLTLEDYRNSFGILRYDETCNLRRPYMFSSSVYIKETKIKI